MARRSVTGPACGPRCRLRPATQPTHCAKLGMAHGPLRLAASYPLVINDHLRLGDRSTLIGCLRFAKSLDLCSRSGDYNKPTILFVR